MNNGNNIKILIALLCLLLSSCVQQKQNTALHTLQGDNSTVASLSGSVALPESDFTTLADLTDKFATDLQTQITKRKIYLDRTNIKDVNTNDVANFSSYLENEMEASLSSKSFQLVYDPSEADYLIGAVFQRYSNMIRIFFKYHNANFTVRKSLDYSIERLRLPKDSLKENLRSKAYKLSANIIEPGSEKKIYIKLIEEQSCKCVSEFSRSFTALVKNEIIRMHRGLEIVDEKPEIKTAAKTKSKGLPFVETDSVLEGEYFVNGDTVSVTLQLTDIDGHVLNSASVDIDQALIHTRLVDNIARKLSDLTDRTTEMNGNLIKISTSKGSNYPVYSNGELMTFLIKVKKPMYVYIYDITSKGDVAMLYPYTADSQQKRLLPNTLYTIPSEQDDFEMFVEPPFGMDAVKVFASPVKLPIPMLSHQVATRSYHCGVRGITSRRKSVQKELVKHSTINPKDLVDYYRGLEGEFNTQVLEDSLVVETKL